MKTKWILALALACHSLLASADRAADLQSEVGAYRRFLIYPHLNKAFELQGQGQWQAATREFERARKLGPNSPSTALYLADAYRRQGREQDARRLLEKQRQATPGDERIAEALHRLQTADTQPPSKPAQSATPANNNASPPPASAETAAPCKDPLCLAEQGMRALQAGRLSQVESLLAQTGFAASKPGRALRRQLAQSAIAQNQPRLAIAQLDWLARNDSLGAAEAEQWHRLLRQQGRQDEADAALRRLPGQFLPTERFDLALRENQPVQAESLAGKLLAIHGDTLLDSLSFRLEQAGYGAPAARLLLASYPFARQEEALQLRLLHRLAAVIPPTVNPAQRDKLAQPLPTPALREAQALLLKQLDDCRSIRAVLGDGSPHYGAQSWLLLGDCYRQDAPGLAQHAYARASQLDGGAQADKALAYQAYANRDYASSLAGWKRVLLNDMNAQDRLAAAASAVQSHDWPQAEIWLDASRDSDQAAYHWLRGLLAADGHGDQPLAIREISRAAAIDPQPAYYARLASLQNQSGQATEALQTLRQATQIAPDDAELLSQLGYAEWQTGHAAASASALERAATLRPGDPALTRQLVFVHARLQNNSQALSYAEQALDAWPAPAGDEETEQRFALSRLHEELSRRWTFSLDAWSGSNPSPSSGANASQAYRGYSQMMLDYRLGDPASRDGRTLSAYARLFAGSSEQALPLDAPMLGAGLNWKPWRDQVIYLAAEQQTPLSGAAGQRSDQMLRVSASFFNAGRYSDDWHPLGQGWLAQNLYLDLARYLQAQRTAFSADYRLSYHAKIAEGQTLEPYSHLQASGSREPGAADYNDLRLGAGLRWNLWQGQDRYNAYPSKVSVGMEFQRPLHSSYSPGNAVIFSIGGRW
ncbi:tetratricopeptide repeat protein [Chromobacterium sp. IIBBL 290-4]|uniref:NfrA family protein n=1 Tax=Chromobacterium sp. IIBBL 290-4 TaxID=2953890 RepID=UPI0020B6C598|nr:tetratricopeptide repeat protein [Chromobacterium sp. IIBBL 290-4]UTH74154.1 tetratricopeptide repeat protein [Chromobacterium sp. IIBBL 290-4]